MILVLFIMSIILIIVYSWIHLIKDSKKLSIRGPFPLPIVGNGHLFFGDPEKLLIVLTRLARKYNDVCRFYILSHRYVSLSDAKYLGAILSSTELINKGRAYEFMRPWVGEGLITSSGSNWKKQRKFLTPAFHYNILQSFLPIFIKSQDILRYKLTKLANGTPIDLPNVFNALTFDNITESVMGRCFNTQTISSCEYFDAIHDITQAIALRIINPIFSNDMLFNLSRQKLKMDKALEVVNQYAYKIIKERRKELMELNINAINYNANFDLVGLHIPNNTHVFVNIFEMHRNPKFFENPLEFCPERFEDNLKSPFSWIPFSAGPRNCIGQKFAMTELKVMLSSIVRHFELLPSGRIPKLTGDLLLKSENGVFVCLLPREIHKHKHSL